MYLAIVFIRVINHIIISALAGALQRYYKKSFLLKTKLFSDLPNVFDRQTGTVLPEPWYIVLVSPNYELPVVSLHFSISVYKALNVVNQRFQSNEYKALVLIYTYKRCHASNY